MTVFAFTRQGSAISAEIHNFEDREEAMMFFNACSGERICADTETQKQAVFSFLNLIQQEAQA